MQKFLQRINDEDYYGVSDVAKQGAFLDIGGGHWVWLVGGFGNTYFDSREGESIKYEDNDCRFLKRRIINVNDDTQLFELETTKRTKLGSKWFKDIDPKSPIPLEQQVLLRYGSAMLGKIKILGVIDNRPNVAIWPSAEVSNQESLLKQQKTEESIKIEKTAIRQIFSRTEHSQRYQFLMSDSQKDISKSHLFDGRVLVIDGGPGTGKTTTMIQRLKLLIASDFYEDKQYSIEDFKDETDWNKLQEIWKNFLKKMVEGSKEDQLRLWHFFSPTEQLNGFLAKSLSKEGLKYINESAHVWGGSNDGFRHSLALNKYHFVPRINSILGRTKALDLDYTFSVSPWQCYNKFEKILFDKAKKFLVRKVENIKSALERFPSKNGNDLIAYSGLNFENATSCEDLFNKWHAIQQTNVVAALASVDEEIVNKETQKLWNYFANEKDRSKKFYEWNFFLKLASCIIPEVYLPSEIKTSQKFALSPVFGVFEELWKNTLKKLENPQNPVFLCFGADGELKKSVLERAFCYDSKFFDNKLLEAIQKAMYSVKEENNSGLYQKVKSLELALKPGSIFWKLIEREYYIIFKKIIKGAFLAAIQQNGAIPSYLSRVMPAESTAELSMREYFSQFKDVKKAFADMQDVGTLHQIFDTLFKESYQQLKEELKIPILNRPLPQEYSFLIFAGNTLARKLFKVNADLLNRLASVPSEGYTIAKGYLDSWRVIIGIDESTDFTAMDLAAMASLGHPEYSCVTLSGDQMQAFNDKGITQWDQLNDGIFENGCHVMSLDISYRQTPTLLDMAKKIYKRNMSKDAPYSANMPDNVAYPEPLLFKNDSDEEKILWIANRINSILNSGSTLPATAIFYPNDDREEIALFTKKLNEYLSQICTVRSCYEVIGDTKVVVYPVSLVKGLEFEAAFFYNLDQMQGDMRERFLYVGLSRATYYLGATSGLDWNEILTNDFVQSEEVADDGNWFEK